MERPQAVDALRHLPDHEIRPLPRPAAQTGPGWQCPVLKLDNEARVGALNSGGEARGGDLLQRMLCPSLVLLSQVRQYLGKIQHLENTHTRRTQHVPRKHFDCWGFIYFVLALGK